MKLTINVATRNRPQLVTEVLQSLLDNIEQPSTRLMVSVDDDDLDTVTAVKAFGLDVIQAIEPRPDTIAEKWNRATAYSPADVYLPTVDTVAITTKGFDTKILEAVALFPDGIGCVYLPMANASFPALQAPTAKLVNHLGYIYPPYFPFWFVDHWLDDICRMIGRISFADIAWDATRRTAKTIGLRDLEFWTTFYDAGTLHRHALAEKIIDDLDEPDWRRQMLVSAFPLVDARSLHLNYLVRENAKAIEASRGGQESEADDRYKRIMERAKSMLYRQIEEAA